MTIKDAGPDNAWINGFPWMRGQNLNFPILTASDIILWGDQKQAALTERVLVERISCFHAEDWLR